MKKYKDFIIEATQKLLKWNKLPDIGWWRDKKVLTLYHGTNIKNVDSFFKSGVNRPHPTTGMISMALEPNTAAGYASMSGGETSFRQAGAKATLVPFSERAVFVFDIPMSWIEKYYDPQLRGNIGAARKRMESKEEYDNFPGHDVQYYQTAELRFKKHIPPNFIKGYMIKK